jgi:CBS-domain-containing membrane protein
MHQLLDDTVQHNMTSHARTVAPEMTVGDLLRLFAADQCDAYPVVSNGNLVGIVSKSDALKAFASDDISLRYDDIMGTTVDEIMCRHVMTVEPGTQLRHALQLMGAYRFKSLPVVDDENHLQGMIAREDMVRVLTRRERCNELQLTTSAIGYYAIA